MVSLFAVSMINVISLNFQLFGELLGLVINRIMLVIALLPRKLLGLLGHVII